MGQRGKFGVSRRSYLGMVGAASGATALSGKVGASGEYDRVVDIVEAGADNTGEEPIDDVFEEHAEDGTKIEFPDGRYKVNQLILYQLSNFAMVGTGDATLVPGENYDEELWIAGGETRDLRVENFTLDTTESGVSPEIDINAYDGLVFRDIEKIGYQDNGGVAFGLRILSEDGHGLVENVTATDGGASVALYIESDGPMTVRNCRFEEFADNGVYASASDAPIRVEGGVFRNNNVAQVRLGSDGSVVTGATMVVDKPVGAPYHDINMRGVRVADGAGPVTVDDCDIHLEGGQGNGGIVNAFSGGSMVVRDTRIHVGEDYTTVGSDGSRSSFGIFADDATKAEPGTRRFENVSITGDASHRSAVLLRRGDNTIEGLCIDQPAEDRDGIVFEGSSNNSVVDSIIDVTGEEIVLRDSSARRANISTSGSCPEPGESSSSTPTEEEGEGDGSALDLTGEMRRVTIEQADPEEWTSIGFERRYETPVVVSQPVSYEGYHPCHTRVRDVTPGGFDLKFEEWSYLDGDHRPEDAHHLVAAAGRYGTDSLAAEAGHLEANHEFHATSFSEPFDQTPVVLAQPQTFNGTDPIVPRLQNVSADGFEVMLQEEEQSDDDGYHYHEQVGYVAIEPGSGTIAGRKFEVARTRAGVDHDWYTIEFDDSYENPQFLAAIQSFNGANTATLRYRNLTESSVEVFVEEEQSANEETWHTHEQVGYVVVEGA